MAAAITLRLHLFFGVLFVLCHSVAAVGADRPNDALKPAVEWPLERTAYFVGERVPLALRGITAGTQIKLEAKGPDGTTLLYQGPAKTLLLDSSRLAPGDYLLIIDGTPTGQRMTITSVLRPSAGSMQDEATPREPQIPRDAKPDQRAALVEKHDDDIVRIFRESGLTACFALGAADLGRAKSLDTLARSGALLLVNPDTRPTSFFPVGNHPAELDGMSQRMILTAQANGRSPNFGGFCYGWDTTGYPLGGRKGLMTYWGWGDKTNALRNYIARIDQHTAAEFTRRTGLPPVAESEYIAYLLSIGRPDFAPAIDLPTKLWLEEIAQHTKPMDGKARQEFERRLDAWSAYLMGMYREAYGEISKNLHSLDPTLRQTASVQIDHQAIRNGQYLPSAYEPLDLQYQTTWNDQVGGPDYAYQWLFTAGMLDMHRGRKPTWLSSTFGAVHDRARFPGKFTRVAAHGLAWGVSGIGFALEGFSNLLGGMNSHANWDKIRGQAGEADVLAGREFLDRFASLAVEGKGDHGVGVLFSKSQFQRQHVYQGFGSAAFRAFVALTRLGYTPRFVTEEDLLMGRGGQLPALVIIGQTFALPKEVQTAIQEIMRHGTRVIADASTTIDLPGAQRLDLAFESSLPGKPHSWSAPNMVAGDNDALLYARWHPVLAAALVKALGEVGRGVFAPENPLETKVTLMQIDGGPDAKYVIAVNDSHVATQADWHQLRERIVPTGKAGEGTVVYDCTEERSLGVIKSIDCDLTATTARVFAVLTRPAKKLDLAARQELAAGSEIVVSARFLDDRGQLLRAVVPLSVSVIRPDGKVYQQFYRATARDGKFPMTILLPANMPTGKWSLTIRSQLDGQTATLPITVSAPAPSVPATAWNESVIVRDREAIERSLTRGTRFVLPIFDKPLADELLPVAEKVKQVLAARGVTVEIQRQPKIGTYWISYDPTPEQQRENADIDAGLCFGKIKRETVNGNDWFSTLAGYRFGRPVILLDITIPTEGKSKPQVVNPMADTLNNAGLLWPRVTEAFPGPGRGVVQCVSWAYAPRVPTIVLQAADVPGLTTVARTLANLPVDRLTPTIHGVRADLWKQYHVGGSPARPTAGGLTSVGLTTGQAPCPFVMRFPTEQPLPVERISRPTLRPHEVHKVPATVMPKQFILSYRDASGRYIETATVEFLNADLRFSEAIYLPIEVTKAGRTKIVVEGVFRYSDRKPMWQAQWEDIIQLREKVIPRNRRPMDIEVRPVVSLSPLSGKETKEPTSLGILVPTRMEQREVSLEMASPSAGLKPRTAVEEVVTRLEAEVPLPIGRHNLLLIHRHITDGKITAIGVGMNPEPVKEPAKKNKRP